VGEFCLYVNFFHVCRKDVWEVSLLFRIEQLTTMESFPFFTPLLEY